MDNDIFCYIGELHIQHLHHNADSDYISKKVIQKTITIKISPNKSRIGYRIASMTECENHIFSYNTFVKALATALSTFSRSQESLWETPADHAAQQW